MAHLDLKAEILTLASEWPKVIPGLAITVAQITWKRLTDRRNDSRKAELRARIRDLSGFLQTALGDTPEAAVVLAEAKGEYTAAVAELAGLSAPKTHAAAAVRRNPVQRWLLLYTPSSGLAWGLHALYFVLLGVWILGVFGAVSDWGSGDDWDGVIGLAVFGVLILLLRWAAASVDSRSTSASTGRLFTIAMFLSLAINGFLLLGLALGDDDTPSLSNLQQDLSTAVGGTVFLVAVAAACWWLGRLQRRKALGDRLDGAAAEPHPPDKSNAIRAS